ncbi:MAG: winged helix-turn-helix transcriptional regulator [Sedimentisphaerales bacterium]|nr:winged helix-turn-helix transcriptional regulator [Sedimentisphaerales bacterium]
MKAMVRVFKALSDSSRIRILKMLEIRSLCVCEMTEILQLATSTVSKHLSILRDAGLVSGTKEGKWANFHLNHDQSDAYVRHLLPLIRTWLPDDEIIRDDREKVMLVDRNKLCGL